MQEQVLTTTGPLNPERALVGGRVTSGVTLVVDGRLSHKRVHGHRRAKSLRSQRLTNHSLA